MPIFNFDSSYVLGNVRAVDTRKVTLQVTKDENLRKARVGQLAALALPGAIEEWLIGIIEKVVKIPVADEISDEMPSDGNDIYSQVSESILNTVYITLIGTVCTGDDGAIKFSRSLVQIPEIDTCCYILRDAQLQNFMGILSTEGKTEHSLLIGKYTIDDTASAFLDGNRFFQRHAAILGSTGSGKSWSVASILEKAAQLQSTNIIVFDLHGEYSGFSYARQLRVPSPEDLGKSGANLLYLPYWLLNTEELQAMFTDKTEFSAHNQVMVFQDAVIEEKKNTLTSEKKVDVLKAFTLDSPIPFSLNRVVAAIKAKNEEMVPGSQGKDKQGPFFGQFTRLLLRMNSKITDRRYGFLFQAPDSENSYAALANIAHKLLDCAGKNQQIKIVDFSDVPADILPIIVGIVARLIFQIQFWTDSALRKPIALVCDEAHLYLPKKDGTNPIELRAVENFERIAKEGRKYGVALVIVSQRPSDVSTTILSQCNNIVSLRLTNSDDQGTIKKYMPESLDSLLDTLPLLDTGEALVVGDSVLLPSRIKIAEPKEHPRSATIDFWTEWRKLSNPLAFGSIIENMRKQTRT